MMTRELKTGKNQAYEQWLYTCICCEDDIKGMLEIVADVQHTDY